MLEEGNDDDFECLLITYNNNNDVIGHTKLVPKIPSVQGRDFYKMWIFFSTMFGPENFKLWKFYKEILVIKNLGPFFLILYLFLYLFI